MRKIMIASAAASLLVFVVWFVFKEFSAKPPEKTVLHTIEDLKERVYREPFNANYQLEMARVQYGLWKESMKTHPEAPSRSLTSYMIAYFESGKNKDIFKEFEQRYGEMLQYGSMPDVPLDIFYEQFIPLYTDFTKPQIEMVLRIRSLFEAVWKTIDSTFAESRELEYARLAVKNYVKITFDLVTGEVRLYNPETKGQVILGKAFYDKWERGMRSYGQVLLADPGFGYTKLKEQVDAPLQWSSLNQIQNGEFAGRYVLTNGDEVVPGLKYFEDVADSKYSPLTPQLVTPTDVYKYFRQLQEQRRWSEMYDLIDEKSRDRMTAETKIMLTLAVQDEESRRKVERVLETMNGRDLNALILENSAQHPTEILSETIDGNIAHLKILTLKGNEHIAGEIQLVRRGDGWRIMWGDTPF